MSKMVKTIQLHLDTINNMNKGYNSLEEEKEKLSKDFDNLTKQKTEWLLQRDELKGRIDELENQAPLLHVEVSAQSSAEPSVQPNSTSVQSTSTSVQPNSTSVQPTSVEPTPVETIQVEPPPAKKSKAAEKPKVPCPVCSQLFSSKQNLKRHNMRKHDRSVKRNKIKCTFKGCRFEHEEKSRVGDHYRRYHPNQLKVTHLTCKVCFKTLLTKESLKYHKENVHRDLAETFKQMETQKN